MPPTLSTDRLILTPPVADDFEDMIALWTDPTIIAAITGSPTTREDIWYRLLRYIGHWQVAGYGHWMIRHRDDAAFVGAIGIMDSRRATSPSFEGVPELGWSLVHPQQGRGYAREALEASLRWADTRLPRTVCIIKPDNVASIRLAERVGYRRYAEGMYGEKATMFFERSASASDQRQLG